MHVFVNIRVANFAKYVLSLYLPFFSLTALLNDDLTAAVVIGNVKHKQLYALNVVDHASKTKYSLTNKTKFSSGILQSPNYGFFVTFYNTMHLLLSTLYIYRSDGQSRGRKSI